MHCTAKCRLSDVPKRQRIVSAWERILPFVCFFRSTRTSLKRAARRNAMHQIIYLVGLIVVVMFILSAVGLR